MKTKDKTRVKSVNQTSKNLILHNCYVIKNLKNPNSVILGSSGGGKSVAAN